MAYGRSIGRRLASCGLRQSHLGLNYVNNEFDHLKGDEQHLERLAVSIAPFSRPWTSTNSSPNRFDSCCELKAEMREFFVFVLLH